MSPNDNAQPDALSRRRLLAAAGLGGVALTASIIPNEPAHGAPVPGRNEAPLATPPVAGLHLQFGADASSQVVVSWHTLQPVRDPRVVLGRLDGNFEQTVDAQPASYP